VANLGSLKLASSACGAPALASAPVGVAYRRVSVHRLARGASAYVAELIGPLEQFESLGSKI
jgi:hypothetical protein